MTKKDLDKIDMTMFAGLITKDGLDARAEHNIDESAIIKRHYTHKAIPLIFEKFNGPIPHIEDHKLKIEAATEARRKIEDAGESFGGLERIMLRSRFVDGKIAILMGPIDKKMLKTFGSIDNLEAAITLAQLATHEVKRYSIEKIKESRRSEILDELEDIKYIRDRKKERAKSSD